MNVKEMKELLEDYCDETEITMIIDKWGVPLAPEDCTILMMGPRDVLYIRCQLRSATPLPQTILSSWSKP